MADNPMLDALKMRRSGGVNLIIMLGEGDEDPEMEAKELGLAPDAEPLEADEAAQDMSMEAELMKGGLGKMGRGKR